MWCHTWGLSQPSVVWARAGRARRIERIGDTPHIHVAATAALQSVRRLPSESEKGRIVSKRTDGRSKDDECSQIGTIGARTQINSTPGNETVREHKPTFRESTARATVCRSEAAWAVTTVTRVDLGLRASVLPNRFGVRLELGPMVYCAVSGTAHKHDGSRFRFARRSAACCLACTPCLR